jgi:2-keto-4-pentenoate hydratase/2-oxohepta-3-ene-1,7-dioic acid hydratase in catechol pathway
MRFATWEAGGTVTAGVVSDAGLHALPAGTTVLDLVRAGLPAALDAGSVSLDGPAVPLDGVRLLPPLAPPTVRDFVAFEEHVEGVVASVGDGGGVVPEWYEAPTFYFTNPYALVGAHDDVPVPPGSRLFDFECEVAVVAGRDGASLSPEQAREHVSTVANLDRAGRSDRLRGGRRRLLKEGNHLTCEQAGLVVR